MIRIVVTVLLAAALLAASFPAVEHAAADRSEARLDHGVDELDAAATELARSEEVVPGREGARRTVEVTLPSSGIAAAGVERFQISSTGRRYSFRVEGRDERERRGTVPVHTLDDEPLVLRESGTHELVLALVQIDGDRRIVIARGERIREGTPASDRAGVQGG